MKNIMIVWDWYCAENVPAGAKIVDRFYDFTSDGGLPKFQATVYYRVDNGPKRRVDLEWTLTGTGDVLATEPVSYN